MKTILFNKKTKLAGIIIVQLIVCILVGTQKNNFFCDEIYSYGLANSENYSFIDPETAKEYSETGWVDKKYFEDYLQVSREVPFSFKAAFQNQRNDVHPPLYYCILHVFCLLNNGIFSKWTGLALNFVILALIDLLMLYIADYLSKDIKVSVIILLFWTFSGAGLSNILFIRMYMMLTCEMLAYVAVHIKLLERRKIDIRDSLSILLIMVSGGLTHYYFYVFVFCFSAPICICFLLNKKFKKMFLYGAHICIGAGMALCVFPETFMHVFYGYRGKEVIVNLSHGRDGGVLETYLTMINNSMFAGKFKVCLGFVLLLVLVNIAMKYFISIELAYNRITQNVNVKITKRNKTQPGGGTTVCYWK